VQYSENNIIGTALHLFLNFVEMVRDLIFRGPRIVIYSSNKTNEMHKFLKFIFGLELYIFRTLSLSIIRSLALYTQQWVYVIQVMLTACWQAVSITCMTYTYCCAYNARLLMMDKETVRNM